MQNELFSSLSKIDVLDFKNYLGDARESRRRSCIDNGEGGAWLSAVPFGDAKLNNLQFNVMCAYRLNLDLLIIPNIKLVCDCSSKAVIDHKGYHLHHCKMGPEVT